MLFDKEACMVLKHQQTNWLKALALHYLSFEYGSVLQLAYAMVFQCGNDIGVFFQGRRLFGPLELYVFLTSMLLIIEDSV